MIIPDEVERVALCQPIKELLKRASELGYQLHTQRLTDYHFNELYFELSPASSKHELSLPDGITEPIVGTYTCACHWSTVKLV